MEPIGESGSTTTIPEVGGIGTNNASTAHTTHTTHTQNRIGHRKLGSKRVSMKDNLSPKLSYQETKAIFLLNSGVNLHSRAVGPDPVHRAISLEDMSNIDSLDDAKVNNVVRTRLDTARDVDDNIDSYDLLESQQLPENGSNGGQERRTLKVTKLPRGGVYVETCCGPIQCGMPPETIKDCMVSGFPVPRTFIVPRERFYREFGPNIGINVAEFEFPAYYNFFFTGKSVNLIVENQEVEDSLRVVFQETLFGPLEINSNDDFADTFPAFKRPDLHKELNFFRKFGDKLLNIDMLITFIQFDKNGVAIVEAPDGTGNKVEIKKINNGRSYAFKEIYNTTSTSTSEQEGTEEEEEGKDKEKEKEKMPPPIPGTAKIPTKISLPTIAPSIAAIASIERNYFVPPMFGVTVLGSGHGFDAVGSTSGYILWINRRGIMVDPPPHSSALIEKNNIHASCIDAVIVTHCHADHDAGTFQKILGENRITVMTSKTIYESFIRKYSALSGIDKSILRSSHNFRPIKVGEDIRHRGAVFNFFYTLHSIPCVGFEVLYGGKSAVFSADHMNDIDHFKKLQGLGVISQGRFDRLAAFPWHRDLILHEAGIPPIHTPLKTLEALPDDVKKRLYIVHVTAATLANNDKGLRIAPVGVDHTLDLTVTVPSFYTAKTVLDLLESIFFFRGLSIGHARDLLEIASIEHFKAGETIVQKGQTMEKFYIINTGSVRVTYEGGEQDEHDTFAEWSMGDWFGQELLCKLDIDFRPREELSAMTDVELITFPKSDLQYIVSNTEIPEMILHILKMDGFKIDKLLSMNSTMKLLTRVQKLHLESKLVPLRYSKGEYVWKSQELSQFCVIVHTGSLSFEGGVHAATDQSTRIMGGCAKLRRTSLMPTNFGRSSFVGNINAILSNQKNGNTLYCQEDCILLVLQKDNLKRFFALHPGVMLSFLDTYYVL